MKDHCELVALKDSEVSIRDHSEIVAIATEGPSSKDCSMIAAFKTSLPALIRGAKGLDSAEDQHQSTEDGTGVEHGTREGARGAPTSAVCCDNAYQSTADVPGDDEHSDEYGDSARGAAAMAVTVGHDEKPSSLEASEALGVPGTTNLQQDHELICSVDRCDEKTSTGGTIYKQDSKLHCSADCCVHCDDHCDVDCDTEKPSTMEATEDLGLSGNMNQEKTTTGRQLIRSSPSNQLQSTLERSNAQFHANHVGRKPTSSTVAICFLTTLLVVSFVGSRLPFDWSVNGKKMMKCL
ncbi:MAG: hypothetical protein M1812_003322 [Candelaria pacifica]|nr:MAG: hypothetical protein M1812_003322 [Candelaria pacifica]